MKNRTTQPSRNKYYIRKVSGGLNGAVAGKPTIKGANVLCNCVGYANGRFNESINDPELKGVVLNFKYQLICNAENFIESAKRQGLKISPTPIEGGIMVWQKGRSLSSGDGAGHVAFVERVYDDGSILTSESGYNSWAFKTVRRTNGNGRWGQAAAYKFRGCVVNPSIKNPKVVPVPKLTIDGKGGPCTVRAMQRFFGTPQDGVISGQTKAGDKWRPSLLAVEHGKGGSSVVRKIQKWCGITQDGYWGKDTSTALQKKLGVTADGVFGTESMKVFQRYLNEHDKATYPTTPTNTTAPTKPATTTSGASKIVTMAKSYAWAYGTASKKYAYSTGSAKAVYKTALKKYMGHTSKIALSDCGYFVTTCVRAAGVSSKFLALKGNKDAFPSVPSTMSVVLKGKKIPSGTLKAGDVIRYKKTTGSQHTLIYIGDNKIAEAGRKIRFPIIQKDTKKYNNSNVRHNTLQVIRAK